MRRDGRIGRIGLALMLALGLAVTQPVVADGLKSAPTTELTPAQQELARNLKAEVMAPCCWNGTVDSHTSPLAMRVGGEIEALVADGKSREEVLNALSKTYGERVLAKPRTDGFGMIFYAGPALATLLGLGLVWRWMRRNVRSASTPVAPPPLQSPPPAPGQADAWSARFEQQLKSAD